MDGLMDTHRQTEHKMKAQCFFYDDDGIDR